MDGMDDKDVAYQHDNTRWTRQTVPGTHQSDARLLTPCRHSLSSRFPGRPMCPGSFAVDGAGDAGLALRNRLRVIEAGSDGIASLGVVASASVVAIGVKAADPIVSLVITG